MYFAQGLILSVAVLYYALGGMTVKGRMLRMKDDSIPLLRLVRGLPPQELMQNISLYANNFYDICANVQDCYDLQRASVHDTIDNFRIGDVFNQLDDWCPPQNECWDSECNDQMLRRIVESEDKVIEWMCNNSRGFEETACYKEPFPTKMRSCVSRHIGHFETNPTMETKFENCVNSTLYSLPGCAGDKKSFFKTFFEYVQSIRRSPIAP